MRKVRGGEQQEGVEQPQHHQQHKYLDDGFEESTDETEGEDTKEGGEAAVEDGRANLAQGGGHALVPGPASGKSIMA